MLAVVCADAKNVLHRPGLAALTRLVRQHEIAALLSGIRTLDECRRVVNVLRVELPRFHYVPLLCPHPSEVDVAIVKDLLNEGSVPLLGSDEATALASATLLARQLRAEKLIRLDQGVTSIEPVRWARRQLTVVAGGWCARPAAQPCPRSAAQGCLSCADFRTDRAQLHVHEDTLRRARALKERLATSRPDEAAQATNELISESERVVRSLTDRAAAGGSIST